MREPNVHLWRKLKRSNMQVVEQEVNQSTHTNCLQCSQRRNIYQTSYFRAVSSSNLNTQPERDWDTPHIQHENVNVSMRTKPGGHPEPAHSDCLLRSLTPATTEEEQSFIETLVWFPDQHRRSNSSTLCCPPSSERDNVNMLSRDTT